MTCAGLLGLAVGRAFPEVGSGGETKPSKHWTDDEMIRSGLALLASAIGRPLGQEQPGELRLYGFKEGDEYYFLWALERVAVAFDLKTIGSKDWYGWGRDWLLKMQRPNGGWNGKYALGGVDTSFALLFLKQANLAKDLTVSLQGQVGSAAEETAKELGKARPAPSKSEAGESARIPEPTSAVPARPAEANVDSLRDALVRSKVSEQLKRIQEYQEHAGPMYTQALAEAIPSLDANGKTQARSALADRLAGMTIKTLQAWLEDRNAEIRRAAALAAGMKEDKTIVPNLIDRLDDSDAMVRRAAHLALKSLTGKDFGPAVNAEAAERAEALNRWRTWWKGQPK
jgi:hypothetical protein